jgi:predicted metal-binding membrane protein
MTVLFVTGVMNLLWVAAIAVFVLLERVMAKGRTLTLISGVMLFAAGVWMISG